MDGLTENTTKKKDVFGFDEVTMSVAWQDETWHSYSLLLVLP